MADKRNEGLVEPYIKPERGGYSGSQSPQARRGSAQDFEKFGGDRTVRDGITWESVDDSGWSNKSRMHIEDENPAK